VSFSEVSINGIMNGEKYKDIVEVGGFNVSAYWFGALTGN
jgi:hypothetical protein